MNLLRGLGYEEIQGLNKSLVNDGQLRITPKGFSKAMTAGTGVGSDMTDLDTLTDGRAITVENIDRELKVTAEQRKNLVFYNLLRNKPIYAVLDQWMQLSDHGINAKRHVFGKFTNETAFPATSDVTLERHVDATKFIRDMRDLTHVMEQVSTMAEKHNIINTAGAITVLEALELGTIFGNSAAMPNQFDGFYTKLYDACFTDGYVDAIVDCRATGSASGSKGGEINEGLLDKGAENVINALGIATHMVMPTKIKSDLNQILPAAKRVMLPDAQKAAAQNLLLGQPTSGYYSDFAYNGWGGGGGDPHFKFVPSIDVFYPSGESASMQAPSADYPTTALAPTAPSAPTAAVASDAASKFGAGDAGSYWYKVSAYHSGGVSSATSIASAQAIAQGQKCTLTITCNDATITGLSIYRSAMDASTAADCRWVADIAVTDSTGTTDWVDYNRILPGCSTAVLLSNAPETDAVDYRQLMPFVRMELPFGLNDIVGYPYLYMLYTYLRTPKLANARTGKTYHVLYTNVRWSQSEF